MSTEEDGVDEAGRTTQSPLIMAPPSLEADPDGEAADTIIDNDSMSSSRKRTESSRSGASQRAGDASGDPFGSDDAATAEPAVPAGEDDTKAGLSTAAAPAAPAAATSTAAASPSASSEAETGPSYSRSSYTGTSSYSPSASPSPSGYSRSAWAASADAAASPASAPPAPDGGAGGPASSRNGYSSGNGFSSSAASAVTGAAAGLAGSVSSAWPKRGSGSRPKPVQTRKSTKRQAMLTLARVEPWSVMKFSFVASVVAFIILFVAVAVLYMVLSALGVFDSLQNTVSSVTSSQSDSGTNISHWFSASLILGYTAMLGALNIVLITAMSTVGSVIYNLIAKTIGGIEVTLRETD